MADAHDSSAQPSQDVANRNAVPRVELMEDVDANDILDEDEMDLDDAEESVGFAEQLIGVPSLGIGAVQEETGESSDDLRESGSDDDSSGGGDREFAHVSRSPILLYQPRFSPL